MPNPEDGMSPFEIFYRRKPNKLIFLSHKLEEVMTTSNTACACKLVGTPEKT
jgi:hypothetical protein